MNFSSLIKWFFSFKYSITADVPSVNTNFPSNVGLPTSGVKLPNSSTGLNVGMVSFLHV